MRKLRSCESYNFKNPHLLLSPLSVHFHSLSSSCIALTTLPLSFQSDIQRPLFGTRREEEKQRVRRSSDIRALVAAVSQRRTRTGRSAAAQVRDQNVHLRTWRISTRALVPAVSHRRTGKGRSAVGTSGKSSSRIKYCFVHHHCTDRTLYRLRP